MFELKDEKALMYSDERTVVLTTHRIIQTIDKGTQQMMMEDFIDYKMKTADIGNYRAITFVVIVLNVFVVANAAGNYMKMYSVNQTLIGFLWDNGLVKFFLALLSLSLFFDAISRSYIARIIEKINAIECRVKNFRKKSVKFLLKQLEAQNALFKTQKQKSI